MNSSPLGPELARQAAELAERHGWDEEPTVVVAYLTLSSTAMWLGQLDGAEPWLERAGRALRAEVQPGDALMVHYQRGLLELARGRNDVALAVSAPAVRLAELVVEHHSVATKSRAVVLHALIRLGVPGRAEAIIAGLDEIERGRGETRCALAALRLAQGDPRGAAAALAPVLDGSAAMMMPAGWTIQPFLLEAIARDALGDSPASEAALEHALDLAEPYHHVFLFLLHPVPALLERHCWHRATHAALISEILALLAGTTREPRPAGAEPLRESLTEAETRILRYLPTHLSALEISVEMFVSVNTVRTHMRHLYAKLGAHRRGEAVARARTLGLLAPSRRDPS